MCDPFVFDPRHSSCKAPFGAVTCGQSVTLNIRPLAAEGFSLGVLVLRRDYAGTVQELPLIPQTQEGDRVRFTVTFSAPEEPELLWYYFRFTRDSGETLMLDRSGLHAGGNADVWQITIYRPSSHPRWFGEGVTYQIFPDRFCRLAVPDAAGLVGNRKVHRNWDEIPDWQPDEAGEIRNCDFFGGSLAGIMSRLDDLAAMGVSTLYLNPIFESASNHRYNTADYTRIDPMLGTEEDFSALCAAAKERGMHVVLDGVFNHTGSQSRYFNADGFYPETGAAQSKESPWFDWFDFKHWPDDYESWWGIKTLPAVRESCPSYLDYIIENEHSIVRRWLRAGASGWRLDVADELPDEFIRLLRAAVEEVTPDALVLGEVWEDASNKISYERRRRYFTGDELHGVMNYPFRTALLNYLSGGDADAFRQTLEALRENYPPDAFHSCMNFLSTHDTPRILTVLGADFRPETREARAAFRLSPREREKGLLLVRLAALVLFSFPGSPTVYYGDEAGMEGWEDPFNRGTYPEDGGDHALRGHFALLGSLRRQHKPLHKGALHWLYTAGPLLAFAREAEDSYLVTAVNSSAEPKQLVLNLPFETDCMRDLLTGKEFSVCGGTLELQMNGREGLLLEVCPPKTAE